MTITVYRDTVGEWRWRLKARNGRVVGDSAEGYRNRGHCVRMAKRVAAGGFPVEVPE